MDRQKERQRKADEKRMAKIRALTMREPSKYDYRKSPRTFISAERVIVLVARRHGVKAEKIISKSYGCGYRDRQVLTAREEIAWRLCRQLDYSYRRAMPFLDVTEPTSVRYLVGQYAKRRAARGA